MQEFENQELDAAILTEKVNFQSLVDHLEVFQKTHGATIALSIQGQLTTNHWSAGGPVATRVGLVECHRAILRARVIDSWVASEREARATKIATTGEACPN